MTNGLYSIGLSAARAYQSALNVIGNNLANMNNPDYSRQIPQFTERPFRSGVDHSSTTRMFSGYLTTDLRNAISNNAQYDIYYQLASVLDSYLGSKDSSVGTSIQDLFSSMQAANNNPSSLTSRAQLLNQANSLVSRFQSLNQKLDDQTALVNQEIKSSISRINQLSKSIADLNNKIMSQGEDSSYLDQRDGLLKQLSEYLPINTSKDQEGRINVSLSNGLDLVDGSSAATLDTAMDTKDPRTLSLTLVSDFHTTTMGKNFSGGKLGGLFKYYDEVIKPSRLDMDRLALVIADEVNQQHQAGLNLNNETGLNFFNDINSAEAMANRVLADAANGGSGTFSVSVDDAKDIQATDYQLSFTSATDYTLVRNSDGQQVASGSIGSYPEQISVDGFTLNITAGSFSAGDDFTVTPASGAANQLKLAITKPEDIALAIPVRTSASLNNQGSGEIHFGAVTDITNSSFSTQGQLSPPLKIEFLSDTSYQIVNDSTSAVIEGPITFTPGGNNNIFPTPGGFNPGYTIKIDGKPAAGDSFTVGYNTNASSDNRNGLLLTDLGNSKVMNEGKETFADAYLKLTGSVAERTSFYKMGLDSSDISMQQAENARNNYSGVNDQEEIANMLFFQQAFEANAKLVAVADSMFSTIMDLL